MCRMGILASGQLLYDIGMRNGVHDTFSIFSVADRRENVYPEGFSDYLACTVPNETASTITINTYSKHWLYYCFTQSCRR